MSMTIGYENINFTFISECTGLVTTLWVLWLNANMYLRPLGLITVSPLDP